jgi:hypothetical protein
MLRLAVLEIRRFGILLIAFLFLCGCRTGQGSKSLRLEVKPSSPTLSLRPMVLTDGAVKFVVSLENSTRHEVTVCTYPTGVITIDSVSVDGRSVTPNISPVSFDEDPRAIQPNHLKTLRPGEVAQIVVSGLMSDDLDRPGAPTVSTFEPSAGKYAVRFRYHYSGPDAGRINVFHGTVYSPDVAFEIRNPIDRP